MKRSAWRRVLRNCHHLRKIRYQETSEKATRMASTNLVSRLDVSTSSHGVVGTARPTCSNTRHPSRRNGDRSGWVPGRVRLVPPPRAHQDLFQAGALWLPAQEAARPPHRGNELRGIAARRVTGRAIPTVACPRRPGDPPELVAAVGRAGRLLGWQPQRSGLEEILVSAWQWHQTHPSGYPA